ncbi:MAG: ABC transporter permease [Planctomycetes bacterium]|nr:ABC transporter permease [Planctomycetota bacterium]
MSFVKKIAGAIAIGLLVYFGWIIAISGRSVENADVNAAKGIAALAFTWVSFISVSTGRTRYFSYAIGLVGVAFVWLSFIEEKSILEYPTIAASAAVIIYLIVHGIIFEQSERVANIAWALGGVATFLIIWGSISLAATPKGVKPVTLAFSTPVNDSVVAVIIDEKGGVVTQDILILPPKDSIESLPKLRTLFGSSQPTLTAMPPGSPPASSLGKLFLSAKAEYGGGLECFEQDIKEKNLVSAGEAIQRARELQITHLYYPRSTLPDPTRAFIALVDLSKTHVSSWKGVIDSTPPLFTSIPQLFKTIPSAFPDPQGMLAPLITALDDFQRQLTRFNEILGHAFASILRVAVGFFFASALGIPFGLAIGSFAKLNATVNSVVQALRPISPIAWLPVATIGLGGGTLAAFFLIFLSSFFAIVISAAAAVATLDLKYRRSAMNFGIRRYEFARCVLVPACMPSILTSLRVAVGIAWIVIVAAEMLGVEQGLGYLVLDARNQLNYDRVVAAMMVIGIIGLTIDIIFRHFEQIVLERRGLGAP